MQIKATMRCHLILFRTDIIRKSTNNKWWRGCGEKGNFQQYWWECKLVQLLQKTIWTVPKKLKVELSYDPAIPLLGMYLEETLIQKDKCSSMFTAALFPIVNTWRQPNVLREMNR